MRITQGKIILALATSLLFTPTVHADGGNHTDGYRCTIDHAPVRSVYTCQKVHRMALRGRHYAFEMGPEFAAYVTITNHSYDAAGKYHDGRRDYIHEDQGPGEISLEEDPIHHGHAHSSGSGYGPGGYIVHGALCTHCSTFNFRP